MKIRSDQLLKLLKPVYGLSDSGDHWHATRDMYLEEFLGITPPSGDLSCLIGLVHGNLTCIIPTYIYEQHKFYRRY